MKILVVGPQQVGKTAISNFLMNDKAEAITAASNYRPTVGVRILEDVVDSIQVELWDCSGDQRYENCWPAIMRDADGVIILYNPDNAGHQTDVNLWYDYFVKEADISDRACMVLAHRPSAGRMSRPPPKLEQVTFVQTTWDSAVEVRRHFVSFINSVNR